MRTNFNRVFRGLKNGRQPSTRQKIGQFYDRLPQSYMPLVGMGSENLIKGLVVQKEALVCRDGVMPRKLRTHNLARLAGDVNVPLSEQEAGKLANMSKLVEWQGKYASPTTAAPLREPFPFMHYTVYWESPHVCVELFKKILKEYKPDDASFKFLANLLDRECPPDDVFT